MKRTFLPLILVLCLLLPAGTLAEIANFNPEGLPVVDETITLHIIAAIDSDFEKTYDEQELIQRWAADTNVDIDWILYDAASWTEKKNMMLASADLPDVLIGTVTSFDELTYAEQGYWLPLQDLIANYTVNMKDFSERYPDIYQSFFAPDGNLYKIPRLKGQEDMIYPNRTYINRTWLDQLGLEAPTNIDEFTEVLRAFKAMDPDKIIPFAFRTNDPITARTVFNRYYPYGFFGTFGRFDTPDHIVLEDGEVVFTADKEEFRNAIRWFRMAMEEGLIDPEAFTMDTAAYKAKNTSGDNVYGVWTGWTVEETTNPPEQGIIDYEMLPPLFNVNGEQIWPRFAYNIAASSGNVLITSVNKYPEATIRFLDYAWDPYFSIQTDWGIDGLGSVINDDGSWEILGGGLRAARMAEGMAWNFATLVPQHIYDLCVYTSPVKQFEADSCAVYSPYGQDLYPNIYFTLEETQEMTQLFTDICSYIANMTATWIVEGGIEEQWDDYVATLNQMGLERYVQIYADAYARFIGA